MSSNPFNKMTAKIRLRCQLNVFRDRLLRPIRPMRIDPNRNGPANLLMIGIDTLRADHLGLGGYPHPTSPCLDRLAATGTLFEDVTAPAPWTLPSFSSALTGHMPGLHGAYLSGGVRNMDTQPPQRLNGDAVTLAAHLRRQGYRTAAFYSNQFFGFGLAESFDHHTYANVPAGEITRMAWEWIRQQAGAPFFCFILLNDPHEPTTPKGCDLAPFLPRLRAAGIMPTNDVLRPYARWGEAPGVQLTRIPAPADAAVRRAITVKLAIYDATIRYVDRIIGALDETLSQNGLMENTVISIFSDHGEEFLDHAQFSRQWAHDPRGIHGLGHGHAHFQEVLHVPWITWGAGIPAGQRVPHAVSLLDLSPTLLAWLDLPPLPSLSGSESFRSHLMGTAHPQPGRLILSEAIAYGPDLVVVRRHNLKLIAHRDGRPLALFDLGEDPGETSNVVQKKPEDVAALLAEVDLWRKSGCGADGQQNGQWHDMDDTIRQRLKDLGYSD